MLGKGVRKSTEVTLTNIVDTQQTRWKVQSRVNTTTGGASGVNTTDRVPQMVFVDDEGLKEQFLTEDEAIREVADTTAIRVMTPVENEAAPLDPIYTQRSQRDEDLDLQPSRGPREKSLVNALDQYLGKDYEDVLHTSNIQRNFSISASNRDTTGWPALPLGWIVPDGTNGTLEEICEKKISQGISPGGGQAGAVVVNLQRLEPYYRTPFFLIDLETGEVFGYLQQQWRRAGLYCLSQPFTINDLMLKIERHGQAMQAELEAEQQTPVMNLGRAPGRFEAPPPLPAMDEPVVYVKHPDVMEKNTRKNYVCDHMRAALIYISEYAETQNLMNDNRYRKKDLLIRLRAVFGHVDKIRSQIDQALQQDDAHRRRREMRFFLLPTWFPSPESMGQGDITVWTNWICEETDLIMSQLEEKLVARGDPDDPFNGSANGVFRPLHENFSLPRLVQMPKRQTSNSECSDSSQKSLGDHGKPGKTEGNKESQPNVRTQGEPCETSEHSINSLNPMRNSQALHVQQRQCHVQNEARNSHQECNLITFTPLPRQEVIQEVQIELPEPRRQRTPRKRKQKSEWNLNQRQFNQNKPQEILPSVSYLQLPTRKVTEDNRFCSKCGEPGHWKWYC